MKSKGIIILLILATIVLFPITERTAVAETREVYLGGTPIGIGLVENGLIVTGTVDVITDEGAVCPARGSEILIGDVIVKINDEEFVSVKDFAEKLQKSENEVTLTLKRGGQAYRVILVPATDILTGLKKIGLTLKNGITGIGTLTFIEPKSMRFAALGHGVPDVDTGKAFLCDSGYVYSCTINSFRKAEEGKAGELSGHFVDRDHPIGIIEKCNEFGVYGSAMPIMTSDLKKVPIGTREEVKTGKATIYSTISGNTPKAYMIEIVKVAVQKKPKEKSMLIRVTDEELLRETGGILQGMSGSPIVQNGKLIGAVTHVLINDSTLGYALYADWMFENAA